MGSGNEPSGGNAGTRTRPLVLRLLTVASVSLAVLGAECGDDGGSFDPVSGDIHGLVTGDGAPRNGVTVTLSRGGSHVATLITPANGEYRFSNLDPGVYTVAISAISGQTCPGNQIATLVAGGQHRVDFTCTTPEPPGTVEGRVFVNDVGALGVVVVLNDRRVEVTEQDGSYRFTNIAVGAGNVRIREPDDETTSCPITEQPVSVTTGGAAVADFHCTGQVLTGRVTVNGIAEPSATVFWCDSLGYWDGFCVEPVATDSQGRFVFTSFRSYQLRTGLYFLFVSGPTNATCPELSASVAPGETVTVDVACVRG